MSDQLERYVAALLGAALAATWAAAGAGPALVALAAAMTCYAATMAVQHGWLNKLLAGVARDLAASRSSRTQPSGRPSKAAKPSHQARSGAASARRPRPAPVRLYDEALSDAPLAPAGPYGW
jgi:hypothetical protein